VGREVQEFWILGRKFFRLRGEHAWAQSARHLIRLVMDHECAEVRADWLAGGDGILIWPEGRFRVAYRTACTSRYLPFLVLRLCGISLLVFLPFH